MLGIDLSFVEETVSYLIKIGLFNPFFSQRETCMEDTGLMVLPLNLNEIISKQKTTKSMR